MSIEERKRTSGGRGNLGKFIERDPKVCAAGVATAQGIVGMHNMLQRNLLEDKVDALVSDAILPLPTPRALPPLRAPPPPDKRHSSASSGELAQLLNPPNKTKFQTLVEEFKESTYSSYWNKPLGHRRIMKDQISMLPKGMDVVSNTFGRTYGHENLYDDIVMPKTPLSDKMPNSKGVGTQIHRNYFAPPFDPDLTYGDRNFARKEGRQVKCCLTYDKVLLGTYDRAVMTRIQAATKNAKTPLFPTALPCFPAGHAVDGLEVKETSGDSLEHCLITCERNIEIAFLKKCLKHLNILRKVLRKRIAHTFFPKLYLNLQFFDKEKTGWLPKETVYNFCATKGMRFNAQLIEPLLILWRAFDGSRIEYKSFVHILNYREPSPELPNVFVQDRECIDYHTTYSEMVKPNQPQNFSARAGVPSGRYFNMDYPVTPFGLCKAVRTCLPEESDMKSCINPSNLTLAFVSHRDMFAVREPDVIRRVIEASYENFTDERFNTLWEEAKKLHSQGFVCYQTFFETLEKFQEKKPIEEMF